MHFLRFTKDVNWSNMYGTKTKKRNKDKYTPQ